MRIAALTLMALTLAAAAAATPEARRPAPPLSGVTLDGKQLSLAKLRGKPVFINIWSSW